MVGQAQEFYLVGRVPVRVQRQSGAMVVYAFNRYLNREESRPEYWSEITFDRGGLVRHVHHKEYQQAVRDLKAETVREAPRP